MAKRGPKPNGILRVPITRKVTPASLERLRELYAAGIRLETVIDDFHVRNLPFLREQARRRAAKAAAAPAAGEGETDG
jgi:hypothetical protein